MSLLSRQNEVMKAIKATIEAHADLAAYVWRIQKLTMHRGAVWNPGYYISPLSPEEIDNETQLDIIDYRSLVAVVNPAEPTLTGSTLANHLAIIERVEDLFRNKGGKYASTALRNLNTVGTGANLFTFQQCLVRPADRFVAAAFGFGYDCSATIVHVRVQVPRRLTA